jgi:aspartyl-tRNA(Asn)/glutamyl-tRNA(Gln) amidotransferase subunit A
MSETLLDRSICEIGAALRSGSTRIEDLTADVLDRHARRGDVLNAYKYWAGDSIKTDADAAAAALAAGYDHGPLMGLPVSFKDIFGVAGMPTCAGTPKELPKKWRGEGPVVAAMRGQFAVISGKTHSVEFAFGGVGTGAHWPSPRNPWDANAPRVSGGSSSGAGVSIAEGSALLAFGTDTGGSVRIPASVTGQVGLKTSIGCWSTAGIVPLSSTFDTPGLMTRSVEDAIIAFGAVNPGCDDPTALLDRLGGLAAGDLRLGICDEHFWDDCSPGIVEGVRTAIDELTGAGAQLNNLPLPEAFAARTCFINGSLFGVEGLSFIGEEYPDRIETLDPNIKARFDIARKVSGVDYFTEKRNIEKMAAAVDERLRHVDVLVAPTVPMTPPTIEDMADARKYAKANGEMTRNTQPINLLALCALTMPVALDAAGMPVGLQLITRHGAEEALLAAALACEKTLGTARARIGLPPLCRD